MLQIGQLIGSHDHGKTYTSRTEAGIKRNREFLRGKGESGEGEGVDANDSNLCYVDAAGTCRSALGGDGAAKQRLQSEICGGGGASVGKDNRNHTS